MKPLHNVTVIPPGSRLSDVLPAFAHVTDEYHLGTLSTACAGCRKPFSAVRKRRKSFRLYDTLLCQYAPVATAHSLCGRCWRQYRDGGDGREALLASIEAFDAGKEANQ